MQTQSYIMFHLNMAFSSIPEESRPALIQRCYWPLLHLVETSGIPVGIELTGWTLEKIQELDPAWVGKFKSLLHTEACELIGSGYTQMIGPIVPFQVNQWNQKLGVDTYQRVLGVRPSIVLVNEMAYSSGMVDVYVQAGYQGIIMDRDNVRLALQVEHRDVTAVPTHALGSQGTSLPVLWSDSILFQKLQQFVHGDIAQDDYLGYLEKRIGRGETILPVYCNDAEVFDFRPGRFTAESKLHPEGEWVRIERIFKLLQSQLGVVFRSPKHVLQLVEQSPFHRPGLLSSAAHPVPTKKQAKYNIARWAATGRNDTWLNTMCHRIFQRLSLSAPGPDLVEDWRTLCELWASDLRTHITQPRWDAACARLTQMAQRLGVSMDYGASDLHPGHKETEVTAANVPGFAVTLHPEGILVRIESEAVTLVLNMRRGLAIQSLAWRAQGMVPIVGTLPHGYFSSIALGADYYSGGLIAELPGLHSRVTDLDRVEPTFSRSGDSLCIAAVMATKLGDICKEIRIDAQTGAVSIEYRLVGWERNKGVIRAGILTLMPEAFHGDIAIQCANGGPVPEHFVLNQSCDHSGPASTLVSSINGLGATDGKIVMGDRQRAVEIAWNPAQCAVLPLLMHKPGTPHALTRVLFSMQELDDTSKPEGRQGKFTLTLSPGKLL
jgi:hypothetical protein